MFSTDKYIGINNTPSIQVEIWQEYQSNILFDYKGTYSQNMWAP